MPESSIRVDRDRIIYGSILSFKIDDVETGATTGEATVRRAVEYFDVTVEQVNGTIAKSIINDQRFLELTLAEANLANIRRAWDDAGAIIVSQTFTNFGDVAEQLPWGLAANNLRIYMVGDTNAGLHSVDNLGRATRVRASNAVVNPTAFGLATAELLPRGIAFIGDQMYMVGETNAVLYALSSTDGTATTVPSSSPPTDFGTVAEDMPRGLASDGTTLWMVGETGAELYTLDTTTGIATALSTPATTFGLTGTSAIDDPRGLAHDGTNLYMLGQNSSNAGPTNALYQVDTTTGIATRIGSSLNFGVGATNPTGLTWFNNSLWMNDQQTARIYKLSNTTGMATAVGDKEVYNLNNPSNTAIGLEHKLELISPGADARYRRYTFYRAVSISEGEHMIQKDGLTMVPLSFEILNDPLKAQGAQFGKIEDIPSLSS